MVGFAPVPVAPSFLCGVNSLRKDWHQIVVESESSGVGAGHEHNAADEDQPRVRAYRTGKHEHEVH